MLTIQNNDVLGFIRDFELSSREFLLSQGLSEYEIGNAYLDLQWKFLHIILEQPDIINNYA
jgi:hypothetical protein